MNIVKVVQITSNDNGEMLVDSKGRVWMRLPLRGHRGIEWTEWKQYKDLPKEPEDD